ncbi:helix-turn-helix domain-containing protein [Erythrobacter sp. F6033]|uniref:helix-turn-helix domain-containing protein n=1 Tax=Erythrobacter sp. F6033 TaxID=2926401 RepID=UPI001FF3B954|nr:helix-turn-helix domain-containing protein [Erythrobacter sp. F6033]MCK0128773.1 helix-turn-helix domain-containing protein [Erythrobacter sp. F6033]
MIEQWVFLVRVLAVGGGLTLIAMVVASEVRLSIRVPLVGMLVGVIGYLLNSTPLMTPETLIDPLVDFVALSTPFWIWLFGRRLFEREPERRIMLGAAAAMFLGWFLANFVTVLSSVGFVFLHLVALALIVDLVRIGVFEREDDLVEERRIVRLWLPLLVAAQAGQILLTELAEMVTDFDSTYPPASLLNSVIILVMMFFSAMALFRTQPELLPAEEEQGSPPEELPQPLDLTPSEHVLHDKLKAAMADGTYRETGLSIAALADHLDTPEHRLRALINRRLGYRNFSAFLNRHRIAEAREKLSNPDDVDLPVLTIAMDLGYNSLPTFNRAFRTETGTTPSEFRRLSFSDSEEVWGDATGQN